MRRLKTIVTVLAMFAWLFSISHCHLEAAGLVGDDNCGEVQQAKGPVQGDPCDTDCKILEESAFKLESTQPKPPAVAFLLLWISSIPAEELSTLSSGSARFYIPCPKISLIVARTSLPARAPSLVS